MSAYQYYDFRAIDRPLTKKEMAALRSISTQAAITTTSFTNHYEWGDLKANPSKLMEKYFDAVSYVANWGGAFMIVEFGVCRRGMTKTTGRAARSKCRPKSCETSQGRPTHKSDVYITNIFKIVEK